MLHTCDSSQLSFFQLAVPVILAQGSDTCLYPLQPPPWHIPFAELPNFFKLEHHLTLQIQPFSDNVAFIQPFCNNFAWVVAGGGDWLTALVTNRCPECLHGSLDQAINGNGRWQVQWYATPCPVGDSKLMYSITVIDQYWFSLVVSNTL